MKRIIALLGIVTVLVLVSVLGACELFSGPANTTEPANTTDPIVGDWKYQASITMTWSFAAKKSFTGTSNSLGYETFSGNWNKSESTYSITMTQPTTDPYYGTINENALTLTSQSGGSNFVLTKE